MGGDQTRDYGATAQRTQSGTDRPQGHQLLAHSTHQVGLLALDPPDKFAPEVSRTPGTAIQG